MYRYCVYMRDTRTTPPQPEAADLNLYEFHPLPPPASDYITGIYYGHILYVTKHMMVVS